jgi:hypothetical protein
VGAGTVGEDAVSHVASSGKFEIEVIEAASNSVIPTPKIDLRDAHAIRRELASVYRDMRAGRIASQDGTRLAYVLDLVRKSYETAVLEQRVIALETGSKR